MELALRLRELVQAVKS